MRKTGSLCFILILLSSFCYSQTDSAQWVLDKFLEASGGRTLWDSTVSVSLSQTNRSYNGGFLGVEEESIELTKKIVHKSGDATISTLWIDDGIKKRHIHCVRGDLYTLHVLSAQDTTHLFPATDPEFLKKIKEAYGLFGIQQHLLHPAIDSLQIGFGGRYKEGEQEWWLITLTDATGTATWYVNTKTYYVDRNISGNGRITSREAAAAFGGRIIPTIRRTYKNGQLINEVRIQSARFNEPLPDCPFEHSPDY